MSPGFVSSVWLGLSALGLAVAQIELPPELEASSERIPISGFGGHNKGTFRLADLDGEFKRGESRLGIFDPLYVSNSGKSSFTLREPQAGEVISADCEFSKKAVTIDIVTFDPRKFTYQCDFRRSGSLLGARLAVGQPKASGFKQKLLAHDLRRGEAIVFDQHVLIDSVHSYKGTKLKSQPPIGYRLSIGERAVAALELTDVNPTLFVATDVQDDLRRSIYATALALAVLRDPANSALEE